MDKTLYDVAIIGGGPGGYSAALYCARAGFSVVVLEKAGPGGQMATTGLVDNYPGFPDGVDGFELGQRMQTSAHRFGAETVTATVKRVELTGQPKVLETSKGVFRAHCVILASGAYPRTLGLPEEDSFRGRGVSYCATCDGMFYRNKTVAVVGGGNSAVTEALHLVRLCKKVYLIHRRDALAASKIYTGPLEQSGVEILWNSKVTRILDNGQTLSGVELEDIPTGAHRTLDCDGLFVAIGRVPDTELYRGQVELDDRSYVVADETTCTNIPGVFAVGDLRTKPLRQILTAASDGATSATFVEEHMLRLIRQELHKRLP